MNSNNLGDEKGPQHTVGPAVSPATDDVTQVLPTSPSRHYQPTVQVADPAPRSFDNVSASAAPPGTLLGDFEVIRVIGEGGFGIVYEAKDLMLLRHVAVKEYMPVSLAFRRDASQVEVRSERLKETFDQGLRSFINEARLLVRFNHPSLVSAYRFWEANGTAYMVMPLYKGQTLKQKLKGLEGRPTQDWLLNLLDPLTEALHVLHVESCFHRDIAPDNILLLDGDERPILIDFGAARQVIGDMTQTLTAILKPGFAPAEQYASSPEWVQGPWTDAYALASTVHFAITGFTPPSAVDRLLNDKYVPLASRQLVGYEPPFLAALDRALNVRPQQRPASMLEFRAALGLPPPHVRTVSLSRAVPAETAATVATADPPPRPPTPSVANDLGLSQRRLLLFSGLGAAAVASGAAWWWSARGSAPVPPTVSATDPVQPAVVAAAPAPAPAPPAEQAPAAAPAASVAAPTPVLVDTATLFQNIVAAQTPGFTVQAASNKAILKIDKDRFGWQVQSARDGYVHILGLGPDGTLLLVFPNSQDNNNRIRAGQTLKLPRDSWPLEAAEPAGREELLVIVSTQPRSFSGVSTKRVHYFLELPTGAAAAALQARWPDKAPWLLGAVDSVGVASSASPACQGDACQDYGAARFSVDLQR